jgi:hypothetical protein
MKLLLVLSCLLAAAVSCVPPGGPSLTSPPTLATYSFTPQEIPSLATAPGSPISTIAPTPQPPQASLPASIVDPLIADAASRTSVAPGDVIVVSSEEITWPDRGLGCPLPGVEYLQVPVDGYRLLVRAGGEDLDYRGTGAGQFRLCETK